MKVVIVGLGVQGYKRNKIAGKSAIATIDPFNSEATNKSIDEVPLENYDAAIISNSFERNSSACIRIEETKNASLVLGLKQQPV